MSNIKSKDLGDFAEKFAALANPKRLEIFRRLASCCEPGTVCSVDSINGTCVSDLGKDLGIVPSTVSHHVKELRRAGLIQTRRAGQKIECWVDSESLEQLKKFLSF